MFGFPLTQLIRIYGSGEGTSRSKIRQQDGLLRRKNRGSLGHEMHTAKDDDFSMCLCCLSAQPKRVTNEVGNILDFGTLVIVRKNYSVALFCECLDPILQLGSSGRIVRE